MDEVCGFAVVRKPDHAAADRYKLNLRLNGKTYRGTDRLPWEDLDDAYYNESISRELFHVREQLERQNKDLLGPRLLRDYAEALTVWQAFEECTEIIALWSPEIARIKGSFQHDGALRFVGLDCVSLGEWSVILRGVFCRPNYFSAVISSLNEWGLCSSDIECDAIYNIYSELSLSENVEPLMINPTICHVRVFVVDEHRA